MTSDSRVVSNSRFFMAVSPALLSLCTLTHSHTLQSFSTEANRCLPLINKLTRQMLRSRA